jgi:hypothetical protein
MLLENENLLNAEIALNQADEENIIELCRVYLHRLSDYRDELYNFQGDPEINLHQISSSSRRLVEETRKSIRTALESITLKRNQTETLLKSFTVINGSDVVKTFNQLEYKGSGKWVLQANRVRLNNGENNEQITIQEAVEIASSLRRRAYIAKKITFFS